MINILHLWLIFVDLLQQGLGVRRGVVLDYFRRIAVVDLNDKLGQLSSDGFVKFLQKLQSAAL
jgi:hypothetical protein